MQTHLFTEASAAKAFIQAGNAYLTLRSRKTGTRYTYRVRASKDGNVSFVSALYGPDNESSYVYLGMLKGDELSLTAKSKATPDDPRWKAFSWTWEMLRTGSLSPSLEVWHDGRCGCCGRRLTVPESIASGIGPECAKRLGRG
jgi:hypothetical protein